MKYKYVLIIATLYLLKIDIQSADRKIALLYPSSTISLPTENSTWLVDNFYQWELFLIQNKYSYETIDQIDIESKLSDDYSLLILPSVKSLSDNEALIIKDFMREGNSVLATCGTGVYSKKGMWNGWNQLEQMFGVSFVSEITHGEASRIHSLFGGTLVSRNIPAGFRLQITTYDKPVEVRVNSAYTFPIGYWLNQDVPFQGIAESENTTSAVYGRFGRGNFVWLGFEMSAVIGSKSHKDVSSHLFKNIVEWLRGDLVAQIETWPNGKQSAAVFSCDVEFKFDYINNALDILEEESLPSQFYILTESIDKPSFERLKNLGDVGLHGDEHTLFKWQDYNTQFNRISRGLKDLERISGNRPIAFRPPETFYDETTLEAMDNSNLKVLSSDFIEDRAVPQFLSTHPKLIIIPKTGFDDYDVFMKLNLEDINAQADRYLSDFYRVHKEGGLYTLNYHTQLQCKKEFVEALRKPIQVIKSKDVWITTHNKIYDWWLSRNNLTLKTTQIKDDRLILEIENTGETEIEGVTMSIIKNKIDELNNLNIIHEGKSLDYTYDYVAQKIKLNLPRLYPKKVIRLSIN